jgi:hypothetical protein
VAQKTLTDLGANCTQTSTTITLNKADLGLTVADASLDQIIAAIFIKAESILTEENFNNEPEQNLYITNGFLGSTTKNNQTWETRSKNLYFTKPDDGTSLNPNEY